MTPDAVKMSPMSITPGDNRPVTLRIGYCGHDAALLAVRRWHYSACLPTGKLVRVGAWEDGEFIGCVLFSRGASPFLGRALGLQQTELCELTRVALREHRAPVTQIVAEALRLLRASSPGLRVVISFADPTQGHHGGIYQAGGWIYTGSSQPVDEYFVGGKWRHVRSAWPLMEKRGLDRETVPRRTRPGKYRYLMPLDKQMRRRIVRLAQPYPAPRGRGVEGDPPALRAGNAGSTPAARSTSPQT